MRYRLTIEYDGTDFHGSQAQAPERGRTVQGELETALEKLEGAPVRVALAGRTDAGVHALGQVASFDLTRPREPEVLRRALNAWLPPDLAVREAAQAADEFHARFSARGRAYRYLLWLAPAPAPLLRRTSWHLHGALDVVAMNQAAALLLGPHDFASFAGSGLGVQDQAVADDERVSTVREIFAAEWSELPAHSAYVLAPTLAQEPLEGHLLAFDIAGNAFLPQMVRTIVATLVRVGQGKLSPDQFEQVLAARNRRLAAPTSPPQGLCLLRVWY